MRKNAQLDSSFICIKQTHFSLSRNSIFIRREHTHTLNKAQRHIQHITHNTAKWNGEKKASLACCAYNYRIENELEHIHQLNNQTETVFIQLLKHTAHTFYLCRALSLSLCVSFFLCRSLILSLSLALHPSLALFPTPRLLRLFLFRWVYLL